MFTHTRAAAGVRHAAKTLVALFAAVLPTIGSAGPTDIAQVPLFTSSTSVVKPNLMFILDDSGSMAWNFMPDVINVHKRYGRYSAQCNGVAYNPSVSYKPPLDANGNPLPNAPLATLGADLNRTVFSTRSLTTATNTTLANSGTLTVQLPSGIGTNAYVVNQLLVFWNSSNTGRYMQGHVTSWNNSTGELVVSLVASAGSAGSISINRVGEHGPPLPTYYVYKGTQPAQSYKYASNGAHDTTTTFWKECNSLIGSAPGSDVFTAVTVTAASTEAQNFANWAYYYSNRMLMMKSAVTHAFKGVDDKYRVGFATISAKTAKPTSKFIDIKDFDSAQKTAFYTAVNAAAPIISTPLRGALSQAGRYFANKAPEQASDPMQYSCQKNFTILSTDGYWNTGDENATYGPFDLDGNQVGQQDGDAARPMRDGTTVTEKTVEVINQKKTTQEVESKRSRTRLWSREVVTVSATRGSSVGCSNSTHYRVRRQAQRWTQTEVETTKRVEEVEYKETRTTEVVNGGSPSVTVTPSTTTKVLSTTPASSELSPENYANHGTPTESCTSSISPYTAGSTNTTTGTAGSWSSWANGTPVTTVIKVESFPDTVSKTTTTSGAALNTLADVAMYYYQTDLRDKALSNCKGALGTDVCANDPATAPWQRMTTFTLGMGVSGTLNYTADYETATSGDFFDLKQGTKNWPDPGAGGNDARAVDDLWHAAVNGRGKYFGAQDPTSLALGLKGALNSIAEKVGSGSAAATSTLKPVSGDDDIFIAQYRSAVWTGDLLAYKIDLSTGEVKETVTDSNGDVVSAARWSAAKKLDERIAAGDKPRTILYRAGTALKPFVFSNLDADGLGSYFSNVCSKTPALSQCVDFDATQKAAANKGDALVTYLRGQPVSGFRERKSALGDIGNATPMFLGKPPFLYTEYNYAKFRSDHGSRKGVVYVAANDGMLHAFSAATGEELWAYVPTMVMPNMYKLADHDYATKHQYFVDGSPVIGDIYVKGAWKTILVGGLGAGGKGYYALDITDPDNPKSLWEFTDPGLGLSFGNPVITKRADGTWMVVFTSGYNNSDGKGYLFALNADSGAVIAKLSTDTGDTANPSGLGKLNAWVESEIDNVAARFYAGDLLGNVWRFKIDPAAGEKAVVKLATLMVGTKPQPITVQPLLAEVDAGNIKTPVVYVGTGRYLGTTDLSNVDQQSIYALKDDLSDTGLGDVRAGSDLVQQVLSENEKGTKRTVTGKPVDWSTKKGWFIDLPSPGERVNIEMQLVFNVLTVATNIPKADACTAGGSSWLYRFDIASGGSLYPSGKDGSGDAGVLLGGKQIVGSTSYQLPSGVVVTHNRYADGTGGKGGEDYTSGSSGVARRSAWRELVD